MARAATLRSHGAQSRELWYHPAWRNPLSDPNANARPAAADEDVDELPGETAPHAAMSQLSLEEQIAQLTDLEIDEAPAQEKP